MIHSFEIKNFYSFAKKASVSFEVNNKAPNNNGYMNTVFGNRVSKIETIIGANASGKTNLLKVLPFIRWFICESFNLNPDMPLLVKPFMFGDYKNLPIELSVEFELNNEIYKYILKLNQDKIIFEELKLRNKTKERLTYKSLFKREWNEKTNKYTFSGKNYGLQKSFENTLRTNASVISVGVRFNHKLSTEIRNYWIKMNTNVDEAGWIGDSVMPNQFALFGEAFNFLKNNQEIRTKLEKLLTKFDIGLEELEFKEVVNQMGTYLDVQGVHQYKGSKVNLRFEYESSGTKQMILLLRKILVVLNYGGIAVIDEMDSSLHPEMVLGLVDLFIDEETNPTHAQLIFSTHSLLVLNKLDKYQIIFTEKSDEGITETWRLDEIEDVRSDDNFYAKYIAGAYGGIPKIN
jgi:hypothetical protein